METTETASKTQNPKENPPTVEPQMPATQMPIEKNSQGDKEIWQYPRELANDLQDLGLPERVKAEIFGTAWEYTRVVIPTYTDWPRYVAFLRMIVVAVVAEFRGDLVDVMAGSDVLGYNLDDLVYTVFAGTPGEAGDLMGREFRAFLLFTADKSGERRSGELFRRYVNTLPQSPRNWFRLRDCDGGGRLTLAAGLACNGLNDIWFTEEQFEILAEMSCCMYDAVAFFKHRSEGETNSTFAYMPAELRRKAFKLHRDTLWALDVCWARKPGLQGVVNFVRHFGGPLHMTMRRYCFVEDDLTIGRAETEDVIDRARQNFKLWHRLDETKIHRQEFERYQAAIAREGELMFPGMAKMLEEGGDGTCNQCKYRASYGTKVSYQFGGVEICAECKVEWQKYFESFPVRAAWVFPELSM
ncbi:hypothetical protein GLAREA_04917 [Glarea lozoyensis ATCC 20868]|uniref:ABA 3 protein n=1 Tax=Glarea lozoyensis (strain ATCC 20868 / MF5171) TaxID=1116229 RepID=S3D7Y6_GLAL2|nr:uncharacterized protein GLAREA_04917 [Glarea lozoyensis ATCC 20868]EPE28126.1 hypothetical protein GLAREA_04917 [Glarea lozoyensis ATCC 20868]